MLCFSDISQKILYDTTKAEGELLSLINSTISHEMRNPLNSIINQCTILESLLYNFKCMRDKMKSYFAQRPGEECDIHEFQVEFENSLKI